MTTMLRNSTALPMTARSVSSRHFHYDRVRKQLSCEASQLGSVDEGFTWLQPVYSDSCDLGIAILSSVTGKTERFIMVEERTDAEGSIKFWAFRPLQPIVGLNTVIVFND